MPKFEIEKLPLETQLAQQLAPGVPFYTKDEVIVINYMRLPKRKHG